MRRPLAALVLSIAAAGCGKSSTPCPGADFLEPVYWSGDSASCSQVGQLCPLTARSACLSATGTAECFDYATLGGRGAGWVFHMTGEDTCCPKSEPDAGAFCEQPPDAGAHLCRYPGDDGGTTASSYLCASGAWCRSASCP